MSFPTIPPELREFNRLNMINAMPDRINIRRKQISSTPGESVPDGFGGFKYVEGQKANETSSLTTIHANQPCRITEPRANRMAAEGTDSGGYETDTRYEIMVTNTLDVREDDEIEIILMDGVAYSSQQRMCEIKTINRHTEGATLKLDCVDLNE
jgi:hypothetical protein